MISGMKLRDVSTAALLAALYAAGVIALAGISFEVVQVRIADMLLPLSMVFGLPAVVGITIGTLIANSVSPLGVVDIVGGTLANLVATYVAWKMAMNFRFRGKLLFATIVQALIITFIVGTYLQLLLNIPDTQLFGIVVPGIIYTWLGVLTGSLIAIVLAGYALLKAVIRFFRIET